MRDTAEAFIIGEEEQLVLHNRAAKRAAKLILVVRQFASAHRFEESLRIQNRVAQELPRFTVILIGAAFDAGTDHGAGRAAELGTVVVGFNFELGKRVRIGLNHLIRKALVAGPIGIIVHTVEHEIIQLAALAVDVERSIAAGVGLIFERRFGDAGREQSEIGIRSSVERQFADLCLADHLAARTGLSFEK